MTSIEQEAEELATEISQLIASKKRTKISVILALEIIFATSLSLLEDQGLCEDYLSKMADRTKDFLKKQIQQPTN